MEASVVGAVVGASIQVLLQNLLNMSQEQISLFRDFEHDLEELKNSFSMVMAFLYDAEKIQVNNMAVRIWLRNLEALAFEADNVFDEIDYEMLYKKVGATRNKTVKKKVNSLLPTYRPKLGRRIKDINKKLKSINQQATGFGLQTISAQAPIDSIDSGPDHASASRETDSFSSDPVFLGRENDVLTIVEMLISTSSRAEKGLSVLPIIGMGGLGKTTLARNVFVDERIISHFGDNRVWVYVSRNFNVRNVLKNILISLTKENVELETREALLQNLQKQLETKRYLLVLDDHWNGEREKWDSLVNSLLGISSAMGNCMIVTTRSEGVASIVETLPAHRLEGLSDDKCWLIIKAKAFTASGDISLEFETIGINIAKRCKGMPLAAKVVGGLLFGKSKDEWVSIEKYWLSDFGDESEIISKILKLSFDHLTPPSLKKCFAYFSIFPKGKTIIKENLIKLWMAEGFLQTGHQRSNINMEIIGTRFLNLLVQNSLLQFEGEVGYGASFCYMHDLVHDLACSVSNENGNIADGICQRRYIGYKPSGDGILCIPKGQERYVRTLFFSGKVSDIKFSDFESLHTLILVGEDIYNLPTSIRELKHLRYLDISVIRNRCLPNSIGELYHLQTLKAYQYNLKRLPDSLSCLISLRHLHICETTTLPPGIGKLTSLQTLQYFHVGGKKGCGISELGKLKDLKGKLEIRNLEKVRDKKEAMSANLIRKSGIVEINLVWNGSTAGDESNVDESVLEGLQPHPNLKSLSICGFKGKILPPWTSKMAAQLDDHCWEGFNNLVWINLFDCSEVEELPILGHLPQLKSLFLIDLTNVKSIGPSFYGIVGSGNDISDNGVCTINVVVFPALEMLWLKDMTNLKEWDDLPLQPSEAVVVVFPCLEHLKIQRCGQLIRAPSHFPSLEKLEIEKMESGLPLENICGMMLTTLTHLKIREIKDLECLPDWIFSNNHNLSKVDVSYCPKMTHLVPMILPGGGTPSLKELRISNCLSLRELPGDLHSLNSLEKLVIWGCPDLKSIPYPSSRGGQHQQEQGFSLLKELEIGNCAGLTNLSIEMLESWALSLEELTLGRGLSSLTNTSEVIGRCLHKMTHLRDLYIHEVPKFSIISSDIRTVSSLKRLVMRPDSSWNNDSFNEIVDAMLLQSTSLRELTLYGYENWECLPDGIQHLNALEYLTLYDFGGIEALPEWFGNLSSLEKFTLWRCEKLRHLPSKQAMQRLSKLRRLDIQICPLLLKEKRWKLTSLCIGEKTFKERLNRNNRFEHPPEIVDSEWPKISHVPTILVDGSFIRLADTASLLRGVCPTNANVHIILPT